MVICLTHKKLNYVCTREHGLRERERESKRQKPMVWTVPMFSLPSFFSLKKKQQKKTANRKKKTRRKTAAKRNIKVFYFRFVPNEFIKLKIWNVIFYFQPV